MKKAFLLILILTVSVISTACVNNIAIQELNNNAIKYMNDGDYENAIDRLKSSIDLDDSKYETHYNLGTAYTKNEDYKNAIIEFEKAIELNPDYATSYYAIAIAYENNGKDIINPPQNDDDIDENFEKKELDIEEKNTIVDLFSKAIDYYNKYLEKISDDETKNEITQKIEYLNSQIEKYKG